MAARLCEFFASLSSFASAVRPPGRWRHLAGGSHIAALTRRHLGLRDQTKAVGRARGEADTFSRGCFICITTKPRRNASGNRERRPRATSSRPDNPPPPRAPNPAAAVNGAWQDDKFRVPTIYDGIFQTRVPSTPAWPNTLPAQRSDGASRRAIKSKNRRRRRRRRKSIAGHEINFRSDGRALVRAA